MPVMPLGAVYMLAYIQGRILLPPFSITKAVLTSWKQS